MNRVILVIGKGLHVIEHNPVKDKDRKTQDKPASGAAGKIKGIKNKKKHKLVGFEPDQDIGKRQVNDCADQGETDTLK